MCVSVGAVRTAVGLSRELPVVNKGVCWEMRRPQTRRSSRCGKFIFGFYVQHMRERVPACTSEMASAIPLPSTACVCVCEHSSEINTGSADFLRINLPHTCTHTLTCAVNTR